MQATTLNVFGSLRKSFRREIEFPISVELSGPTELSQLLQRFALPMEAVQLVMINHKAVPRAATIHPGDHLALFPREYPFFADWKDYRSNYPHANDP
jgi:hypothetical protein